MKKLLFIFAVMVILFLLFKTVSKNNTNEEPTHKIGRDTVCIWNDGTFEIGHYADSNYLEFHYGEELSLVKSVLEKVITYKKEDDKFFVVTGEGYAVIDDTNIAKVLVTILEDEYINGYHTNAEGERIPYSRRIDDPHIIYLENFEEFSESEQEMLNKLLK